MLAYGTPNVIIIAATKELVSATTVEADAHIKVRLLIGIAATRNSSGVSVQALSKRDLDEIKSIRKQENLRLSKK